MRNRFVLIMAAISLMASTATAADRKLAERYLEVAPMRGVVEATLYQLFTDDRERVAQILDRMDFSGINAVMVDKIAKAFTDKELKAAITYYSSQEGKSFSLKMPAVVESVNPMLQEQLEKSLASDPAFSRN